MSSFRSKKTLIAISPDTRPEKAEIVRRIAGALPDHKIIEIRKMTYQQYKEVIRDAKFMFTFGEGLDGYFVELIFSGAVAMAIFESATSRLNIKYWKGYSKTASGDIERYGFHKGCEQRGEVPEQLRSSNTISLLRLLGENSIGTTSKRFTPNIFRSGSSQLEEHEEDIAQRNGAF